MPEVSNSLCPDCGAGLAMGVCPACALGFLSTSDSVPVVSAKEPNGTLVEMHFDRYILKRKLAAGGMGVVYEAEDSKLKRMVALKMIRGSSFANSSERSRFMIEAEAAAALDHRNIVPIYEIGVVEEQPFFTMKLIDGQSFAAHLNETECRRLAPEQLVSWMLPICRAVQHAHQRGVLHRDLKPANILIDEQEHPWLMDFGLAKLAHEDSGLTKTSDHLGTPSYMPPEVVDGKAGDVSTASDIWALGVILWEALCGKLPFAGSGTAETMRNIAAEEPAGSDSAADKDLLTLARRCLEKDPAKRVASAGEVAEELERWQRGEPLHVRRVTAAERLVKWVRRKPALAAFYLVLAAGVVSSLMLWKLAEDAVDDLTATNDQLYQALAISDATQLAMEARLQVKNEPALGLLLAVESVEQTERNQLGVLPEAVNALYSTLQTVGGIDISLPNKGIETANDDYIQRGLTPEFPSKFSPDRRWLMSIDYINSETEGVVAAMVDLPRKAEADSTFYWQIWPSITYAQAYHWFPDSRRLLTLEDGGTVLVWSEFEGGMPNPQLVGEISSPGKLIWRIRVHQEEDGQSAKAFVVYGDPEKKELSVGEFAISLGEECTVTEVRSRVISVKDLTTNPKFATRISQDGRWLLVIGQWELNLVDLGSGKEEPPALQLPDDPLIVDPEFSENGEWLAYVRKHDNMCRLIDLRSGIDHAASSCRSIVQLENLSTFPTFSKDGERFAVGVNSRVIEIHETNPQTEKARVARRIRMPGGGAMSLRFSDDGKWLAAGSKNRLVSVWPTDGLADAAEPVVLSGLDLPVVDLYFSKGAKQIAAAGMHGTFRLWDFDKDSAGTLPRLLPGQADPINQVSISPDNRWIASGCGSGDLALDGNHDNGLVKLSELDSGREWVISTHAARATSAVISRDGRWLASTGLDGMARVWDFQKLTKALQADKAVPPALHEFDMTRTRLRYHRQLAFHPRGTLYCTNGDGILFTWDLNSPDPAETCTDEVLHSGAFLLPDVEISPDGKWMALARHGWEKEHQKHEPQYCNMVLLFDVSQPGEPVPLINLPANFLDWTNLAFSPDSRWLAAGSAGVGASVWDLEAEDIKASRVISDVASHRLTALSFSPDGKRLALGGSNGLIHLWNWRHRGQEWTISTDNAIESLEWLDDHRFVSGGRLGRIGIWETDISRLKEAARGAAGRDLREGERALFRLGN